MADRRDSRVGDQNVQAAEPIDTALDGAAHVQAARDIARDSFHGTPARGERLDGLFHAGCIAVKDANLRSLRCKPLGRGSSDPLRRSRHQHHLAGKPAHAIPLGPDPGPAPAKCR